MRKKRQVNRLLTSMIMSMVALSALSQTSSSERPTLVVGIIIDQLRSDYIELLQSHYGEDGFKHLINDGVYIPNVDFKISNLDPTNATALLLSGAYPNINGIQSEKVYNPLTRKAEYVLSDSKTIGNFTDETFSPEKLMVSTLADELRVDNNGLGYVYSISPNPQQAIVMAGHAGNSAFWINDISGKWATTTYYKDAPALMQSRNYQEPLSSRLDTMAWTPILKPQEYPFAPTISTYYPFRYSFLRNSTTRYKDFKNSALVNEEVTSVALNYLKTLKLGKRGQMDMLNIAYTVAPFDKSIDGDSRVELQDSYLRLDRQLGRLFQYIEKNIGLQNTLIYVASTGYFTDVRAQDSHYRLPSGEFHSNRATSLLNMYLMAIYGNGNWVDGYDQNQIFLNRKLLKEKNLDLLEVRSKSADFLRQMSGVAAAYTLDEIINNPVLESAQRHNRSLVIPHAGDVMLEIMPGWSVVDSSTFVDSNTKNKQVRTNSISAPIFILAPNIKAQKITSIVDATILAPTVSRILRIRSPNAARAIPLAL